jgi:hypothetical protein
MSRLIVIWRASRPVSNCHRSIYRRLRHLVFIASHLDLSKSQPTVYYFTANSLRASSWEYSYSHVHRSSLHLLPLRVSVQVCFDARFHFIPPSCPCPTRRLIYSSTLFSLIDIVVVVGLLLKRRDVNMWSGWMSQVCVCVYFLCFRVQ